MCAPPSTYRVEQASATAGEILAIGKHNYVQLK